MTQPSLIEIAAASTDPVVIEVHGIPRPKGNMQAFIVKTKTGQQRAVVTEGRTKGARAEFQSWREGITHAAQAWQDEHRTAVCDTACRVLIQFRLPRPKSAPRRRIWPDTRPDIDKLARTVLDSITGVLISDDSRVCELLVSKVFAVDAPPGATITLEVI